MEMDERGVERGGIVLAEGRGVGRTTPGLRVIHHSIIWANTRQGTSAAKEYHRHVGLIREILSSELQMRVNNLPGLSGSL